MSSGKSSQRKGAQGERELAKLLEEEGYPMERGGACFGTIPDLVGLPGIHVEVKRVEKLNVSEAMRQAERDADRFLDGAPAVFHRRNREPWLVTMRLSDWLALYKTGCETTEGPRSAASSGRINDRPKAEQSAGAVKRSPVRFGARRRWEPC